MTSMFKPLASIILLLTTSLFASAFEAGKSIGTVSVTCIDHFIPDPDIDISPESWEYKYTGPDYDLLFYRTGNTDWVRCKLDRIKGNVNLVFPDYILYGSTRLRVKQIQIVEPENYFTDANGKEDYYVALSQTIPETADDIWYGPDESFRNLPMYFLGELPFIHFEYGADFICLQETFPKKYLTEIYVARESAYEDFKRYAELDRPNCRVIPFGWDFPTYDIDLSRGTIEQQCNENGWKKIYNFKINGHMTDADITFIKNNKQLRKLDLSGTDMTEIPDYWLAIGEDYVHYIYEVSLPTTVRRIGDNAFQGCRHFEHCSGFKGNEIGYQAFSDCTHLHSFDLSTLEKLGEDAFSYTAFESAIMPRLTEVPNAVFSGCKGLKYADISGAETIGQAAFHLSNLEEVKLGDRLKGIGTRAFSATKLTNIIIPESVNQMGLYTFSDCEELKSIRFPKELKVIPKHTCQNCRSLENVVLPDSLIEIGFTRLPGEVIVDGSSFCACENLTHIDFPESLLYIGPYAFAGTGLKEIKLPPKLRVLDLQCFSGTPIAEITIPDSVNYISDAFRSCVDLKKAVIGKSVSYVSGFSYSGIETVEFANGATPTVITYNCFYSCASLKEFTIPASIVTISPNSFSYSGLESIIIPNKVQKICEEAFSYCDKLTKIT